MRAKRKTATRILPRNYLPWDPLQLDLEVDSGLRVKKNSVTFNTYRTYKRKIFWTPLLYNNLNLFYEKDEELNTFIENTLKQVKKTCGDSISFEFYDFDKRFSIPMLELDLQYNFFKYHPYDEPFDHFLDELIKARDIIKEKSKVNRSIESPNKRLQVIMISFTDDMIRFLKESESARRKYVNLVRQSALERLYIFALSPKVTNWHKGCVKAFDFSLFIGEENAKFSRLILYPDFGEGRVSTYQKIIGSAYTKGFDKIVEIYPLKYTKSARAQKTEDDEINEEELYKEFLKTLDDGS